MPFNRYIIFCTAPKYCTSVGRYGGRTSFLFSICSDGKFEPGLCTSFKLSREKLLESCKYGNLDNSKVSSPDKCHHCAALIRYDGWKIKEDYPWEQVILENK